VGTAPAGAAMRLALCWKHGGLLRTPRGDRRNPRSERLTFNYSDENGPGRIQIRCCRPASVAPLMQEGQRPTAFLRRPQVLSRPDFSKSQLSDKPMRTFCPFFKYSAANCSPPSLAWPWRAPDTLHRTNHDHGLDSQVHLVALEGVG
jgi:hypothetical protein